MKTIEECKGEIHQLGLKAIQDYFKVNPLSLKPEIIKQLHNKAKIGLQFDKEMGVNKRAVEMNYLRVFKMIAENRTELKNYIKKSLPKYFSV